MAAPRTPTMTSLMTWFKDNKDISATTDTENAARSKELLELLNKCREVAERSLALKMLAHLSKGPGQPIVSKCLHAGAWQTLFDWLTRARQTNQTAVLTALMETLQVLPVTLDLLTQNELARTVKQCRKIPEVSAKAKALVTKWKTIVTQTGAKSAAKPSPTTSTAQQPQSARPSTGVAAGAAAATAAKTAVKTATAKRRPSHDAEPQAKVARVKTEGTAQHLSEAQMRASGKFILKEEPGPSRAKTASGTDATVPVASRSFGKKHRTTGPGPKPFLQPQARKVMLKPSTARPAPRAPTRPTSAATDKSPPVATAASTTPSSAATRTAAPPKPTGPAPPTRKVMAPRVPLLGRQRRGSTSRSSSLSDQEDLPSPTAMSPLASPSPKASPAKVTAGASTTPPMAQAPAPAQPAPPKKKRVHWKPDLAEIKYYELEEEERSSKQKHFRDLASGEHERERVALQELRKQHEIKPTLEWHRPVPLNREALQAVSAGLVLERGAESTERDEQLQRCRVTLASVYSGENQVPSSPAEPDEEPAAPTQPCATIPLSNEEALAMEAMRAEEQQQQPQQQQQQPQQQMLSSITDLDVDDSIVDEATLQSLAAALTSQQQPPAAPFDPSSVWGESQASPTRRGAPEYAHVEYAGYDRYRQNIGAAQPPMHREERPPPYEHHLPHPHHPRPHPHASPPPPPPPRGPAPAAVAAHAHAHQHPPAGFGYGRGDRRDFHRRSPPAARRRRDWKPRHEIPCKFFAQGRCARGDSCEFLHERR